MRGWRGKIAERGRLWSPSLSCRLSRRPTVPPECLNRSNTSRYRDALRPIQFSPRVAVHRSCAPVVHQSCTTDGCVAAAGFGESCITFGVNPHTARPESASALSCLSFGIADDPPTGGCRRPSKEAHVQKKFIVRLSTEERKQLGEIVRTFKGARQKVRRAQVLLKADADGPGWTDQQIADAFGCRRQTVDSPANVRY